MWQKGTFSSALLRKQRPEEGAAEASGKEQMVVSQRWVRESSTTAEPKAPSEKGRSPRAEPASVSAGNGTERVRTPRVLTKVSTLGEIYMMEVDTVTSLLDDVDFILLTDCADYREPKSFQEHNEWRAAHAQERRALQHRGVMHVVPTPPRGKLVKSRYGYDVIFQQQYLLNYTNTMDLSNKNGTYTSLLRCSIAIEPISLVTTKLGTSQHSHSVK